MKPPHIKTALPGPKAKSIVDRDRQVTAPAYGRVYPLVVKRASGMTVEDVDGNLFLDFMAGIAVASTGHAHPKVVAAIQDAATRFLHICGTDFYYEPEIALAERLAGDGWFLWGVNRDRRLETDRRRIPRNAPDRRGVRT